MTTKLGHKYLYVVWTNYLINKITKYLFRPSGIMKKILSY